MAKRYGLTIDLDRCVGCRTCVVACKMENQVPEGRSRIRVLNEQEETTFDRPVGTFPELRMDWLPVPCMHCAAPRCVEACPEGVLYQRDDGVVAANREECSGCASCVPACPYGVLELDAESGTVDKCDLCAHRLDEGLEPFCVLCCPTRALVFGDLDDPDSAAAKAAREKKAVALYPQYGTAPAVAYSGRLRGS